MCNKSVDKWLQTIKRGEKYYGISVETMTWKQQSILDCALDGIEQMMGPSYCAPPFGLRLFGRPVEAFDLFRFVWFRVVRMLLMKLLLFTACLPGTFDSTV